MFTEGAVVDTFKAMVEDMFKGTATAKGALVITPSKSHCHNTGADNKKEIKLNPGLTNKFIVTLKNSYLQAKIYL